MAKTTVNDRPQRNSIALMASCEIEALGKAIGREAGSNVDIDEYERETVLRALAARIVALNSVISSVLDNDDSTTEELSAIVEAGHA